MKNRAEIRVSMVALGCSKNLVDAECMLKLVKDGGFNVVGDVADSDVAIINTCGFIESAKKEAIDAILSAAEVDSASSDRRKIIVTGCLPQRYSDDILESMPEVDIVMGTAHYKDICTAIDSLFDTSDTIEHKYVESVGGMDHLLTDREVSTTGYAWLKIGEGCMNRCSFCAIPLIRGKFVSRNIDEIIEEAKNLASKGYREIILAAQDTTNYGLDLYKKRMLPELLRRLEKIEGIDLIRVMYGYMDGITDELIDTIASSKKIAHYLDIPIQHGDDRVLKAMYRKDNVQLITERLERLRRKISGLIVRTTVLVGFPGETEEEFDHLKENLRRWKFDRLGCFMFSPEEGTPAFDLPDQIDEETKQRRYDEIYALQKEISAEANRNRLGSIVPVTIDSISEDGIFYVGRSYGEAPEIDPLIYVVADKCELEIGKTYEVKIVDSSDYELTGVTV